MRSITRSTWSRAAVLLGVLIASGALAPASGGPSRGGALKPDRVRPNPAPTSPGSPPPVLSLTIAPASAKVQPGGSVQFSATVTTPAGPRAATVEWSVNGTPGGTKALGRIDRAGKYTAPAEGTFPLQVDVTARMRRGARSAPAKVTVDGPTPQIVVTYPTGVKPGPVTMSIVGKNFRAGMRVELGTNGLQTTFVSSKLLVAEGNVPVSGDETRPLVVVDPGPPERRSAPFTITVDVTGRGPSVTLDPQVASIQAGSSLAFGAVTRGVQNLPYLWAVNGIPGGNEAVGTIDGNGRYRAPEMPPSPDTVTITATTETTPSWAGTARVTILPRPPEIAAVFPLGVRPGPYALIVRGVGFLPTSTVRVEGIALATEFVNANMLRARGTAAGRVRRVPVDVVNAGANGGVSPAVSITILTDPASTTYRATLAEAGRFLEQASFGPSTVSIDRVRELGLPGWIDEQLALPASVYPDPQEKCDDVDVVRAFAQHMLEGDDQLRQRAIFALGQVFVVSSNKVQDTTGMLSWQRMLSRNALGNFRDLLHDATVDPAMGQYLDLANSRKATDDGSISPNENYAREVMQLFTIGLTQLKPDGTPALDADGNEVPSYDQETVAGVSRALTGWGWAPRSGGSGSWPTEPFFGADMIAFDEYHDTGDKLMPGGGTLAAGGTAQQDLDAVVDTLFRHANTAPFIATRLIRALVKSNPSPEYVGRVAAVFANDGKGVRGNLAAVFRAILLDAEARRTDVAATDGKLREPILHMTSVLRGLDVQLDGEDAPSFVTTREMAQKLLESPSVFNYFSPLHRLGEGGPYAPELQVYTPLTAVARGNVLFHLLNESYHRELRINPEPFALVAGDATALVNLVDTTFFYGRMSAPLRRTLLDSLARHQGKPASRMMTALWVALASSEYAIQH